MVTQPCNLRQGPGVNISLRGYPESFSSRGRSRSRDRIYGVRYCPHAVAATPSPLPELSGRPLIVCSSSVARAPATVGTAATAILAAAVKPFAEDSVAAVAMVGAPAAVLVVAAER